MMAVATQAASAGLTLTAGDGENDICETICDDERDRDDICLLGCAPLSVACLRAPVGRRLLHVSLVRVLRAGLSMPQARAARGWSSRL